MAVAMSTAPLTPVASPVAAAAPQVRGPPGRLPREGARGPGTRRSCPSHSRRADNQQPVGARWTRPPLGSPWPGAWRMAPPASLCPLPGPGWVGPGESRLHSLGCPAPGLPRR